MRFYCILMLSATLGKSSFWRESIRELEHVAPLLPDNYRHYLNLKTHANTVEDAAIVQNPVFSVSTGADHPQMTEGLAISPNFFSVFVSSPWTKICPWGPRDC